MYMKIPLYSPNHILLSALSLWVKQEASLKSKSWHFLSISLALLKIYLLQSHFNFMYLGDAMVTQDRSQKHMKCLAVAYVHILTRSFSPWIERAWCFPEMTSASLVHVFATNRPFLILALFLVSSYTPSFYCFEKVTSNRIAWSLELIGSFVPQTIAFLCHQRLI